MVYTRTLVTPPADEPLSTADAKLHLQIEHSAEDTLIDALVVAARQHVENVTNRALIEQVWDVFLDEFPCERWIELPLGQLQSVGAFEWTDSAGTTQAWTVSGSNLLSGSTTMAHIDLYREPACIRLAYGQYWPSDLLKTSNPIRIRMTCGYGDLASDVPEAIKLAIKLLVRHWYDNRDAVVVGNSAAIDSKPLAMAVDALLAPYRLF